MKNSLWTVIAIVCGIVGFLMGYSTSAYTGIRKIEAAAQEERVATSGLVAPAAAPAATAPAAGGYGSAPAAAKPAAGGYGSPPAAAAPAPAAGGYGAPVNTAKPATAKTGN